MKGERGAVSNRSSASGPAAAALYQVCSRSEARAEWGEEIEGTHALGLFNDGGEGLIVDGTPEEIVCYVDLLHAYVHRTLT